MNIKTTMLAVGIVFFVFCYTVTAITLIPNEVAGVIVAISGSFVVLAGFWQSA